MRVLKFGGAALADGNAIQRAVEVVRQHGGEDPTVVVSAHAGVTASLERAATSREEARRAWDFLRVRHRTLLSQLDLSTELLERELRALRGVLENFGGESPSTPRMRDHILSFGERLSTRVFAAALRRAGLPATPVDAFDLGIRSADGQLDPSELAAQRLRAALREVPGIPVVTGFLALDSEGHLTTLGPNGSDLTAAWFGAALGAEEVHLWKCVPGLLTADPRMVAEAELIPYVDWQAADELARHGTTALHPGTVQPAYRAGVPLRLRDLTDPAGPGTSIGAHIGGAGDCAEAIALAHRERVILISYPLAECSTTGAAELELASHLCELTEMGCEPYLGWVRSRGRTRGEHVEPQRAEILLDDEARIESWPRGMRAGCTRQSGLATIAIVGRDLRKAGSNTVEGAIETARASGAREVSQPAVRSEVRATPCESRVLLLESDRLTSTLAGLHRQLFLENRRPAALGPNRSA